MTFSAIDRQREIYQNSFNREQPIIPIHPNHLNKHHKNVLVKKLLSKSQAVRNSAVIDFMKYLIKIL